MTHVKDSVCCGRRASRNERVHLDGDKAPIWILDTNFAVFLYFKSNHDSFMRHQEQVRPQIDGLTEKIITVHRDPFRLAWEDEQTDDAC